jgi:glycosyltransferase involved in cell wall biosynthesis
MTPRVNVVSTVKNREAYYDRAIPSIMAQSFEHFEFILVDDGSSDGSLAGSHEAARSDERIRVFAPGRLGVAAAYNYGVAQAPGECIARQDFEDRSYPERLPRQVRLLDAHVDVRIVGGYYVLVDGRRNERHVRMPPTIPQHVPTGLDRGLAEALVLDLEETCRFHLSARRFHGAHLGPPLKSRQSGERAVVALPGPPGPGQIAGPRHPCGPYQPRRSGDEAESSRRLARPERGG